MRQMEYNKRIFLPALVVSIFSSNDASESLFSIWLTRISLEISWRRKRNKNGNQTTSLADHGPCELFT
jgi:hypothetical protein